MTGALPLEPLEIASGVPLDDPTASMPALPHPAFRDARAALENELRVALQRPPCVVAFSGGRDSSAILARAVTLARREGLPEPIAVSQRYPHVQSTDESSWQEAVVRHLRLRSWEVLVFDEELDQLGDIATAGLTAHGLLWPPNVHLYGPVLDRARGGSLLTGIDGDGLMAPWRGAHLQAVVHGRVSPAPRDALRIALTLAPRSVQRRLRPTPTASWAPWLRPAAGAELLRRVDEGGPRRSLRWDRRVTRYAAQRYLRLVTHNLQMLAEACDVTAWHPFLSGRVLAVLARDGGAAGLGDRTAILGQLAGDVLPDAVITRRCKADLGPVLWGQRSRAFATSWGGAGVDHALIDPERLQSEWTSPRPRFGASLPLQAAWLATVGTPR